MLTYLCRLETLSYLKSEKYWVIIMEIDVLRSIRCVIENESVRNTNGKGRYGVTKSIDLKKTETR